MSWDSYVTNLLGCGNLCKAAICGVTDGNIWASSDGFKPTQQEVQTLIGGLAKKDNLAANGIRIDGEKYMFLQSDDMQAQGKKGATGITVAKSKTCVIVGVYKEGQQPGCARKAAEDMRDYLLASNY